MIEPAARRSSSAGYQERLRTPWWWYPLGIVVGVLLGAEFVFVLPDSLAWLPILLSIVLAVLVVWRLSSARVSVVGDELVVPGRRLPVRDIVEVHALSYSELRRVVGRHGDPSAFTFVRSWVGPGVQLILNTSDVPDWDGPASDGPDPISSRSARPPEPYWLVSTRHPDRLIAALTAVGG